MAGGREGEGRGGKCEVVVKEGRRVCGEMLEKVLLGLFC